MSVGGDVESYVTEVYDEVYMKILEILRFDSYKIASKLVCVVVFMTVAKIGRI